jgi:hypothetical protein
MRTTVVEDVKPEIVQQICVILVTMQALALKVINTEFQTRLPRLSGSMFCL